MAESQARETSVIGLLSVSCLVFAVLLCSHLTEENDISVSPTVVMSILATLELTAISAMVFVFCKRNQRSFVVFEAEHGNGQGNDGSLLTGVVKCAKHYFTLVGLYVFGTGSVVLDSLQIASHIECYNYVDFWLDADIPLVIAANSTLAYNTSANIPYEHPVDHRWRSLSSDVFFSTITFYFLKVLFFALQAAFLVQFSKAKFQQTYKVRVIISLIASVNVTIWAFFFFKEITEISQLSVNTTLKEFASFAGDLGNDSRLIDCVYGNSTMTTKLYDAARYLYPFTMEYSLVVVSMLHHIWIFTESPHHDEPGRNHEANVNVTYETIEGNDFEEGSPGSGETNSSTVDDLSQNQPDVLTESWALITHEDAGDGQIPHSQNVTTTVVIFHLGFVFIIVKVVVQVLAYDQDILSSTPGICIIHSCMEIVMYLLTVVVCLRIWKIVDGFGYRSIGYNEDDILLLASSCGTLMLNALMFISGLSIGIVRYSTSASIIDKVEPCFVAFYSLIGFAQVILQNVTLIKGSRAKMDIGSREDLKQLHYLLAFLGVSNLAWWILDSFVDIHSVKTFPVQIEYFGAKWVYIVLTTYPLAIFYRFHSMDIVIKTIPLT